MPYGEVASFNIELSFTAVVGGWTRLITFFAAGLALIGTILDFSLNKNLKLHTFLKMVAIIMLMNDTLVNTDIPFGRSSVRSSFAALFRTPRFLRLAFLYFMTMGTETYMLSIFMSRLERQQEVELYADFIDGVAELVTSYQKILFLIMALVCLGFHLLYFWRDDYHYAEAAPGKKRKYINDFASNIMWYERRNNRKKVFVGGDIMNFVAAGACFLCPAYCALMYISNDAAIIGDSGDVDRYFSRISVFGITGMLMLDSILFAMTPFHFLRKWIRPDNATQYLKIVHTSHMFANLYVVSFLSQNLKAAEASLCWFFLLAILAVWFVQRLLYGNVLDLIPAGTNISGIIARFLQSFGIMLGTFSLIFLILGYLGPFIKISATEGSIIRDIKDFARNVVRYAEEFKYYIESIADALNPSCSKGSGNTVSGWANADQTNPCQTNGDGCKADLEGLSFGDNHCVRYGNECRVSQAAASAVTIFNSPDSSLITKEEGYTDSEKKCMKIQCGVFIAALTALIAAQIASNAGWFAGAAIDIALNAAEFILRMIWGALKLAFRLWKVVRKYARRYKIFKRAYQAYQTISQAYKKLFQLDYYTTLIYLPCYLNGFVSLSVGYWQRMPNPQFYGFFLAFVIATTLVNLFVVIGMFIGPYYVEFSINYVLPDNLGFVELEMKHGYTLLFLSCVVSYCSSFTWIFYMLLFFFKSDGTVNVNAAFITPESYAEEKEQKRLKDVEIGGLLEDEWDSDEFEETHALIGKKKLRIKRRKPKNKSATVTPVSDAPKPKATPKPRPRPPPSKKETANITIGKVVEGTEVDVAYERGRQLSAPRVIGRIKGTAYAKVVTEYIVADVTYTNSFGQWLNTGVWAFFAFIVVFNQIQANKKLIEFKREPKQGITEQMEPLLQSREVRSQVEGSNDEWITLCDLVGRAIMAVIGSFIEITVSTIINAIGALVGDLVEMIQGFVLQLFEPFFFVLDLEWNKIMLVAVFSPTILAIALNVLGIVVTGTAEYSAFGFKKTGQFLNRIGLGILTPLLEWITGKVLGLNKYTALFQYGMFMCGWVGFQLTWCLIGFKDVLDGFEVPMFEITIVLSDFVIFVQIANVLIIMAFTQSLIDSMLPLAGTPRSYRIVDEPSVHQLQGLS